MIKLVVSFIFSFTLFALFMVCLGSPSCGDRTMVLIFFLFIFGLIFLWSPSCGGRTMVLFYLFLFALIALLLGFNIFNLRFPPI